MNKKIWEYIDIWSKKIRGINYLGKKCEKCGNDNIFHLTFHHKNEIDKEYDFGTIRNKRWSKIQKELDKCVLLCSNCHREIHVKENISDERFRINKEIYLEYKGTECERCGYNDCDAALDFHHIIPEDKSFGISRIKKGISNVKELKDYMIEELNKCEIICSNCHKEEHVDIELFNTYKEEIYYKVDNFKEIQTKIPRKEVYKMYESGIKQKDIAKHFCASKGTISDIIKKYRNAAIV